MNSIQNYGVSFMAGKNIPYPKEPFKEGVKQAKELVNGGAKRVKPDLYLLNKGNGITTIQNFEQYLPPNINKIPLTCSDGSEAIVLARGIDNVIKNLEKHVKENPNDTEARAQLSKIKAALRIDVSAL